jgi:cytochrome c biogenesis protein ResB
VLLALCGLFLVAAASGCTTTQETAELKQAESKRILERREHKQKHRQAERAKGKKG